MMPALSPFIKTIEYCAYCPKLCRFSCPVAQVLCSESVTPTGKMTVLKLVGEGVLPFEGEAAELFYLCTGCLVSRTYCEHEIEVYPPFAAARREAVKLRVAPEKALRFAGTWEKRGNPFSEDLAAVVKGLGFETGARKVVLFAGCSTLHYFPEQVLDSGRLLSAAGVSFQVFAAERLCCGQPLLALGHHELFLKQAELVCRALQGAELVLSPCPTCADFLRHQYPAAGFELRAKVQHLTEFLAEKINRLPLRRKETKKIIYHDPCHLGRYLGIYDQPRRLLEAAAEVKPSEFFESRERSTCCGGGGGLPVVRPEAARLIAGEKAAAARASGAELLATACPMCRRMLGRAGGEFGLVVEDVATILARAVET